MKSPLKTLTRLLSKPVDLDDPLKIFQHPYIANSYTVLPQETMSVDCMEQILAKYNIRNRPLSNATVQSYKNDIINGKWQIHTGNPICFDKNGNLVNGQHTLTAHFLAGKPLTTLVVCGLGSEAVNYIDGNYNRTMAIRSALGNGTYVNSEEILVGCTLKSKQFKVARLWMQLDSKLNPAKLSKFSLADLESFVKAKSSTIASVISGGDNKYARNRAGVAVAIGMFFEKNAKLAQQFFDEVVAGDSQKVLSKGSPTLALREYLQNQYAGGGVQQKKDYWATVTAIHHFKNGTLINQIKKPIKKWEF